MSDAAALLAAIRASPADDAPRLVYADWLDEHGQPQRAEFIRVQCELARADSTALRRREAELLSAYHDNFAGPLAAPHLRFRFERGFIVGFGHTGVFAARHGTMMLFVQFFPDGHVIGTTHRDNSPDLRHLRRGNHYLPRGTYSLDPFECPATIDFKCGFGTSPEWIAFLGALDFDQINPVGHCHSSGYPLLRPFKLHALPGFDSFPEA
jgi:uncharacterized protein (TIGR02996 family)